MERESERERKNGRKERKNEKKSIFLTIDARDFCRIVEEYFPVF